MPLTIQATQLGLDSLVSSSIELLSPPCLLSVAFTKMPPSLWSLAPLLPISQLPSHGLCLPSWVYGKITKRLLSRTFNYRASAGLFDRFPFRSLDRLQASSQDLCSMLSQMAAPRGADDLSMLLSICVQGFPSRTAQLISHSPQTPARDMLLMTHLVLGSSASSFSMYVYNFYKDSFRLSALQCSGL